jgi:hypothetical protein
MILFFWGGGEGYRHVTPNRGSTFLRRTSLMQNAGLSRYRTRDLPCGGLVGICQKQLGLTK